MKKETRELIGRLMAIFLGTAVSVFIVIAIIVALGYGGYWLLRGWL